MQRCPKCGYRDSVDWPAILSIAAVSFLYMVFMVAGDFVPKGYRLLGLVAYLLFLAATAWRALRNSRDKREYLKLHSSDGHA
jgi:hypothetical protein